MWQILGIGRILMETGLGLALMEFTFYSTSSCKEKIFFYIHIYFIIWDVSLI